MVAMPLDADIALFNPALSNPLAPLPRELDAAPIPEDRDASWEAIGAPARGRVELVEPLEFRPWDIKPMLESALPPANGGLVFCLLQQLHPVISMPRVHAPIRRAKGVLPIGFSSPV